jgi:putative MATE family efflux protein
VKTVVKKYEIDMTHGAIMSKLVTFFVPLMISGVLQLLFNAVDLIVVGNWAGSTSLAAVGATTALINMFTNLFMGISLGANVVAARYFACEEKEKISETVHTAITVAAIMGVVMLFVGLFLSRLGLEMMDTPEDVIDQSVLYMRIYFCGMPFFMVYNYGASILRAAGDTRRPLYYLIVAGVLNAGLNLILVIRFHLGVAGVASATIFSQMVSCVLVLRCLMTSRESYHLDPKRLHINGAILKRIFAIGIPAGIQSTVISFSNVLLQSSVNSFGSVAMAGYTAANNLLGFLYVSINSITQACMSFTSQNYAVGQMNRVKKVLGECLLLEAIVALSLGSVMFFAGSELLGIYTTSQEVVDAGMRILTYTTLTYFLCGFMDCLPGALRGLGHSTVPMILSVIGTVGTRILWIYVLFPRHRSLDFLFISYPASWLFTFVMQSVCLWIVFRRIQNKSRL